MDDTKEFHSEEMLVVGRDNGIIIQPVVAYNHTTMCRVESYIGDKKSHGRVSMLSASVSLRFHGDTVQDFCIKRSFTWYSDQRKDVWAGSSRRPIVCRHERFSVKLLFLGKEKHCLVEDKVLHLILP